jgi:hypothetical protein
MKTYALQLIFANDAHQKKIEPRYGSTAKENIASVASPS